MFTRYCDTGLSAHTIGVEAELPSVVTSVPDSGRSSLSVDITDLAISTTSNNCGSADRVVTVISEAHAVPELYRPASPAVDPAPDTPTITRILLSTVDGVQSGVPTLTTPTLTPTTLRNIQQTFLQASVNVHTQPPESHSNQAGFVPPVVHPQPGSTFISIDSKSLGGGIATVVDTSIRGTESSSKELTSGGPPPLLPISGIISSSTSSFSSTAGPMPSVAALNVSSSNSNSSSSSSDSGNEHTTTTTTAANRRMGGRRPNNTAKLSEEEEKKRLIRRERNKMAAARCRKRRLDQTMTLQEETDRLEEKKSSLQHEISVLQQQREELEFLLDTHKAVCTRASRLSTAPSSITTSVRDVAGTRDVVSTRPVPVVTTACSGPLTNSSAAGLDSAADICVKEEALSDGEELYTNSLFSSIIPRNRALEPVTSVAVCTSKTPSSAGAPRPHRPTSLAVAPLTELGVSIETPSAGLRGFNFDSMMDGGTGLTPVTPLTVGSMATGLTPLTTPIMPHPSASVASTTVSSASKSSTLCSHQQRSNSNELSSPDSLTPKHLVSL